MSEVKQEAGKAGDKLSYAIIYIRMSTHYQVQTDSNSAEMQRTACLKICEDKKLQVKKIIEQVKSGRKYRKDLFDVIQYEMKAGDCIVVYSITRFARKQKHAHNLLDILSKKKCRLICCHENIDTADNSANVGLFAWLAEFESLQTGARVKLSIKSKKDRQEHVGAMPFGYQYSAGKGSPLEVNPAEMEVLQRMRKWHFEEKQSFTVIASLLNSSNVPMAKKKDRVGGWTNTTVKKLILRDDSQILLKGKRSWYLAQQQKMKEELEDSSSNSDSEDETLPEESQPIAAETVSAASSSSSSIPLCIRSLKTENDIDILQTSSCIRKLQQLKEMNYSPSIMDCVELNEILQLTEKEAKSLLKDIIGV